ncbi:glycosyltransferase [Microbacterium alcoholitolerans]|uniref:glycosyltransferase n=1 Tax=unclassified Microbacterium TaxID=2609290 RepID=UPI003D170803
MVDLSIIVPVYNATETIRRCVDSILTSDTYRDGAAEVILVNDGSSDGSAAICAGYAAAHSHVIAIDAENGGASAARNRGLAAASGTFVAFVDSDDKVSADYHSTGLAALHEHENADLVITGFTAFSPAGTPRVVEPDMELIDSGALPGRLVRLANRGLVNSVCNKLYRRSVIEQSGIRFEEGRKSAEDLLFNLDYAAVTRSSVVVPTTGAHFIARRSSATHRLAGAHDELHELDTSLAYRDDLRRRFADLGVPNADIDAYFLAKDQTWFRIMVRNVQAAGTPYSLREQIYQVRRIMDFGEARENITRGQGDSRLAKVNRILYRLDSAPLTWLVHRII